MYKYAKDGVSLSSVLDTRRAKKNGLFPVKIQVVYKRIQRYYPTGKELSPDEWSRMPRTRNRRLLELRADLDSSFDRIKRQVQELLAQGEFSFERLNQLLGRCRGETLNTLFGHRIDTLRAEQRIGTMLWYDNTLRSIQRFASRPVSLEEVTVPWLQRYTKFLRADHKSVTTVSMYLRAIRAILNQARKTGLLRDTHYPFGKGKFEIQEGEGRKIALTLRQIEQIVRYSDGNRQTAYYRDLWFFIYLCNGINVADLIRLKYADILDGEIRFVRQKTERTAHKRREIRAILTPEMQAILERWGNPPSGENYLFPFLSGRETPIELKIKTQNLTRRINRHMNTLGQRLGIGKISTYTARHSFATILKRSGANLVYISESLGHSDLKTTTCYLAGFEREERERNARLLTAFDHEV